MSVTDTESAPPHSSELAYRLRQQSLLAQFGMEALRTHAFDELLQRAAELCAEGMATELCKVLEFRPEDDRLLVRAGVGWDEGVVGHASVGADLASPAGFALRTGRAVISNHLTTEARFRTPPLLAEHGVRRAINVIIASGAPFGVLEVDSKSAGQFNEADLAFMQGFANLIGVAIERHRAEEERDEILGELLTERHRLRESEERLRLIIESARDYAILTADELGTLTSWSPGAEATFGWRSDEIVGQPADVIFTPEDRAAGVPEQELTTARNKGVASDERWHLHKDGHRFWVSGTVRPLHDGDESVRGFVKIAKDETARQRTEALMRERAEHQEVLTREVSHRVKNSLQLVASLLSLQSRATASDEVRHALTDATTRVKTIAEVHDQLWRQGDAATIDLRVFLEDLCVNLQTASSRHHLVFTSEDRPVPVPVPVATDRAVPIGLLVNELVTNAFKYAYPSEQAGGEVRVSLDQPSAELIRLEVADRGRGLPASFDISKPKSGSLGTRLIGGFTRQIDGHLQINSGPGGTSFVLEVRTGETIGRGANAE